MAGTNSSFGAMLNDHLDYGMLKEGITKMNYLLSKVEKDDGWKGGTLPVPFKGAGGSSMALGELVGSDDIGEDAYVRGEVSGYKEIWGALVFNHKDLMEHDGSGIKEKTFLKLLPDSIDDFMEGMKNDVSVYLTNGPHIAKVTTNTSSAAGLVIVDRPERLRINQKLRVRDANGYVDGYVKQINMDTAVVTMVTTRGGSTTVDFSATNILAASGKLYIDGADDSTKQFADLKSMLLSSANGGGTSLYGQNKLLYPYLQAIQVDGSGVTGTAILAKLFDGYTRVKSRGKGNPRELIMSYKNLGTVMKELETSKGAFHQPQDSTVVSAYGWTEITIVGVQGSIKCVGIQEVDDDIIIYMDWSALKFHSNGFFQRRKGPDGETFHTIRAKTGFKYIVDMSLFGELVLNRPSRCGIMYGISY